MGKKIFPTRKQGRPGVLTSCLVQPGIGSTAGSGIPLRKIFLPVNYSSLYISRLVRVIPPSRYATINPSRIRDHVATNRPEGRSLLAGDSLQAIPLGAIACKQAPVNRVNLSSKANGKKQESQSTQSSTPEFTEPNGPIGG